MSGYFFGAVNPASILTTRLRWDLELIRALAESGCCHGGVGLN